MKIRHKRPDHKNALSILYAAEREMTFTLSLQPTPESARTIIRNIYECFRMLGDALLVSKGIASDDHVLPMQTLLQLHVKTNRPIQLIDSLRKLRHHINYYGYTPKTEELHDVISIAQACFQPLLKEVKKTITTPLS